MACSLRIGTAKREKTWVYAYRLTTRQLPVQPPTTNQHRQRGDSGYQPGVERDIQGAAAQCVGEYQQCLQQQVAPAAAQETRLSPFSRAVHLQRRGIDEGKENGGASEEARQVRRVLWCV